MNKQELINKYEQIILKHKAAIDKITLLIDQGKKENDTTCDLKDLIEESMIVEHDLRIYNTFIKDLNKLTL